MERIKQALEKARKERQNAPGGQASSTVSAGISVEPGRITYTQTRSIEAPMDYLREKRIIAGAQEDAFANAYKILRTQVLKRLRDNNWNVLAVTSPGPDEGKTLTAINLAISLAMEVNYTVLLVDADLRHPSVHTYFGLEPEHGLSDYLMENIQIPDLLVNPDAIPGLVVLPGGKSLINSSEMLNSPRMSQLVVELKNRYPSRIVLFDLPPLLSAADALAFAPYVDAALLVIEDGKTGIEDAKRAMELLNDTPLIGTVLNKARGKKEDDTSMPKSNWAQLIQSYLGKFPAKLGSWFKKLRGRSD